MSGRGGEFGGLSGWVVVGGGGVVVVDGGVVAGVGRGGRSELSVLKLTYGASLGVACVVLEVGGGGEREFNGVGGGEGGCGVVVGSCGFGSGESLAECFPLFWACRVHLAGLLCGAGVKVGGLLFGCAVRRGGVAVVVIVVIIVVVIVGCVVVGVKSIFTSK